MKRLLALLLIPVLALSGVSCSTTGGAANTGAIVDIAVSYGVAKHLAGAKNLEQFQSRQADLAALAVVLKTINNGSVDPVALRNLIAAKFGTKPEVMLLANIILTYLQPAGPNSEPRNELIARVVVALEAASQQPSPAF